MKNLSNSRYEGLTVLVTGGGAGLGEAICERLAAEGAAVAVLDYSIEAAQRVASKLREQGAKALALCADVTRPEQLKQAIATLLEEFGQLDMAVNNAGIGIPFAPLADQEDETWARVIDVNLTGVFNSMKAELPHMQERGGAIINIASVTALMGIAGVSPYVAAKHGVLGLTRSAAIEYGKYGVRVNAVCPTFVRTALTMAELTDEEQWQALDDMHPMGRCATPEEVAAMVAFLGSAEAAIVTGSANTVDGGFTTGR
ncbi:SDR family NAD(P)-dependent oxidoreductase [Oceanobacter antarcticus]|uniref:SDR family NAD(P)-dependent oxidoreductase n=1 Tax=Oceanobacter antarcticus TaxID=3133425 RepID=A0ABW8NIM7_9GAMM